MQDEAADAEALLAEQARRFDRERRQAERADDPEEAAQHARRADKASYLADRLQERTTSERESG